MTRNEFLIELTAIIRASRPLTEDLSLDDIPEWDSLAAMSTVSLFEEKLGKEIDLATIEKMTSVSDLIKAAGL